MPIVCPIRIILDRASSGLDPVLKQMDFLTKPVCRTSTCVLSDPVRLEQKPSLTNILNNIKTLRRFCYRPRPVQGQREGGRRTTGPSVEGNRPCCGLSADSSSAAGVLPGESRQPVYCVLLSAGFNGLLAASLHSSV